MRPIVRPRSTSFWSMTCSPARCGRWWWSSASGKEPRASCSTSSGPRSEIPNAKVLSDELNRLAPMLRTVGIDLRHHRTNARRGITIARQP